MKKNGLIAYVKALRERIGVLRTNLQDEIYIASEEEKDDYYPSFDVFGCPAKFCALDDALDDFARWLEEKKDLPEGTPVMCQTPFSYIWAPQIYVGKGVTKHPMDSTARRNDWLYVVPFIYFNPTSTDWRPAESYNWANFGEE